MSENNEKDFSMKNFVTEMRMASNLKALFDKISEDLPLHISDQDKDNMAETMVKGYNSLLEASLLGLFVKDENAAIIISEELTKNNNTPYKLLYEMVTEQIALVIVYQALLYFALSGGINDENK